MLPFFFSSQPAVSHSGLFLGFSFKELPIRRKRGVEGETGNYSPNVVPPVFQCDGAKLQVCMEWDGNTEVCHLNQH